MGQVAKETEEEKRNKRDTNSFVWHLVLKYNMHTFHIKMIKLNTNFIDFFTILYWQNQQYFLLGNHLLGLFSLSDNIINLLSHAFPIVARFWNVLYLKGIGYIYL